MAVPAVQGSAMSHATRSALGRVRRAYTGESSIAASEGVGRQDLRFDHCSPAQRSMRSLISLCLFNGDGGGLPGTRIHVLTHYSIIMSPRYDELRLITDSPDNVTGYLRSDVRGGGIPGMRLQSMDCNYLFRLVHLPTGARLSVGLPRTVRRECREMPCPHEVTDFREDSVITNAERDALKFAQVPQGDVGLLASALLVRLSMADPKGMWAAGGWFSDPLRRTLTPATDSARSRRLAGTGNNWRLSWEGFPFAEDLASMITHPIVGVAGAKAYYAERHIDLRLRDATLRLAPMEAGNARSIRS